MSHEHVDIAIIGGGVSGVYSAWRLKQKFPDKRIVVFEGGDHIGGRLLSVKPPEIDNMVAELGGMRILENTQKRIVNLIKELNVRGANIETYDFPVDEPQNIAYLRGVHLRLAELTQDPNKVPYRLSFLEKGNSAGAIIVNAINQIVPGITNSNLTEEQRRTMAQNASFAGKPLWQQGFWNVLMRVISNEAYQYGVDAGGYNTTLANWNAADAIPWYLSDFGIQPQYKGFKKGFQVVPLTLAEYFTQLGGEIRLSTKVEGFSHQSGKFEVSVHGQAIHADSLILAMPRRSLDLLTSGSPLLNDPSVRKLVESVTPRPLFKLFTTYNDPWWRAAGYTNAAGELLPVESGRTLTDLPVRQTYYWPTDEGQPATSGPAMLMASYDDGDNIGFWDGLRPRRSTDWQGKNSKGMEVFVSEYESHMPRSAFKTLASGPSSDWFKYHAPKAMVEEVARQLETIHGLEFSPDVHFAAFRDWGQDPFGGGWNSWNIGVKSQDVVKEIVHPLPDCPMYICGEAYSDAQGWVEGALQTADLMLEKFGIS